MLDVAAIVQQIMAELNEAVSEGDKIMVIMETELPLQLKKAFPITI
jgi:hypothetical protein